MSGYTRINRPQLLSDSNTSTLDGSLSEIIDNPVHTDTGAYLLSRIGDIGNSNRHPVPGYCLKFDSNNPNVYIQTNIPSSEFNNYNIVIKGEGTKELLKVDTSETNIKIVLRETPTGTDYFNLSYIAFLNKETNSPQHLFECEESSGNILYDAVTGDVATIESITDINSLRISSKYKETIKNENNLQCGIKSTTSTNIAIGEESPASSNHALVSPFNLIVPFSVCITLKFSKSREDVWSEDRVILNTANSLNILNTGSAMNRLTLGITNGWSSLYLSIDDHTYAGGGTAGYMALRWNDDIANSLFDGNWHKLIFIVTNTSNIQTWKIVLDDRIGTYPANTDWMFVTKSYNIPDIFTIIYRMNLNIGKHDGISYKDFYIFNFDMSAADAPYTIEDYRNEVMPVNVDNTVLSLNNISKEENTWLDNSDNLTYTSIQGEYELENKNYGTWCNAVGYSKYMDFLSPSNFDTNLSLTGSTGWKWGNFRSQYFQLSVIDDIDIKLSNISPINSSYDLLYWGQYNNTNTQRRIKCTQVVFKIDDLELSDSLISKISEINLASIKVDVRYITDFSQTTSTVIENNSQTIKYYNEIKSGNTLWEIDVPDEAIAIVGLVVGFYTPNNVNWTSEDYFVYKNPRLYLKDFQDINLKNNYTNYSLNYINIPRKVGKIMKYNDKGCIGNNLIYNTRCGFNAKFVQNNCVTTNLDNSYINLGSSANLYNVKAISFRHKARSITTNNAFFTGFRETPINFIISESQKTLVLGNGYNSAHNWKIDGMTDLETVNYLRDGNWHQYYVEINDSNLAECVVKVDGLNCVTSWVPYIIVGTTTDTLFGCWFSDSGPTYNIDGSICDIKLYNSNNDLIHWYPCAEGAGNTVYDAIGNINGNLYSANANVFWGQTQDIFAYNTIYGYGKISNSDALIPLNSNLGLSFTAQYPKKQNGHNFSEAKLDWSCNTENIPELLQLTGVNNYAPGTTVAGIYKKTDNTGESNFLVYSTEQVGDNLNRINNILKYR